MEKEEQKPNYFLYIMAPLVLLVVLFVVMNYLYKGESVLRRTETASQQEISESDEVHDIIDEFESTQIGSPEDDIKYLEEEASSL